VITKARSWRRRETSKPIIRNRVDIPQETAAGPHRNQVLKAAKEMTKAIIIKSRSEMLNKMWLIRK